jgi:hypothetical protein
VIWPLLCCCTIRSASSLKSSGAAFCIRPAKAGISNAPTSWSGSNFPNPTPGLPTLPSSDRIRETCCELVVVQMSPESFHSCLATAFLLIYGGRQVLCVHRTSMGALYSRLLGNQVQYEVFQRPPVFVTQIFEHVIHSIPLFHATDILSLLLGLLDASKGR